MERNRPDVQRKRNAFLKRQPTFDVNRLVFLDESGFRLGTPPRYGWAPKGKKAHGKCKQGSWTTMTMIGAIGLDGFRGFMTVDAATDAVVFREFVAHELVPALRPGDTVVMDNLSSHRDSDSLKRIRRAKANVVFLPPYSPEFNPIEKTWAKLKTMIRRMENLTREAFDDAVGNAMEAISAEDIQAWFQHAGYQGVAA